MPIENGPLDNRIELTLEEIAAYDAIPPASPEELDRIARETPDERRAAIRSALDRVADKLFGAGAAVSRFRRLQGSDSHVPRADDLLNCRFYNFSEDSLFSGNLGRRRGF